MVVDVSWCYFIEVLVDMKSTQVYALKTGRAAKAKLIKNGRQLPLGTGSLAYVITSLPWQRKLRHGHAPTGLENSTPLGAQTDMFHFSFASDCEPSQARMKSEMSAMAFARVDMLGC